jgi:(2Fe-2S) ferredoxin
LTSREAFSRLTVMPQRSRYLFVCVNKRPDGTPKGSCATRGAVELHAALKAELGARGLAKTEVRACTSSCLDVCWVGPTIAVEPDGYFYGRVALSDVPEIVRALEQGGRVERLVLPSEDFDEATARPANTLPSAGSLPAATKESAPR